LLVKVACGLALFGFTLLGGPATVEAGQGSPRPSETLRAATAQATASPAALPVAVDLQVGGDSASTRIAFTVSSPIKPSVTVLEKPDRILLDLPEVNFQIPAESAKKVKGLLKSVRYGLVGPGRSRIVLELAQPGLPGKAINEPILAGAATSFALEIRKADREAFARAAESDRRDGLAAQTASVLPGEAAKVRGDKRPVIIVDPGHGGIDIGAVGLNDTIEKDVVLAFGRTLKAKLESSGQVRVVMTRDSDVFISLGERVKLARSEEAALFVSIHADTLQASPEVRGLTVYTNSDRASDAEAARLAESENRADALAGLEATEDGEEVNGILGDLMRRETRTYSHLFARTLVGQITAASKLNKNPQRSARFQVLRAPDVPSVLIELGYLSSKSDVELLRASEWREKAADSVVSAIQTFLAPRLAQQVGASAPAVP
jgi:N-acetylmuramoyl-L-alanine amidase